LIKALERISPLLQVADLDASVRFYTAKLGFREVFRDEGGFSIINRDDCDVYLAQKQRDVDLRNRSARLKADGFACYDLHIHCAFGTIDPLWKEFKDAGVEMHPSFESGPIDRDYGIRDFSIIDPDGYDIVFGAPIEQD
jgi:catechol 2,3-dioxygenase-like lactoylglutathione lyase family enzyme